MKLTPEELAKLIQTVMANLAEKRAANKEADAAVSTEDILSEVTALLKEMLGEDSEPDDGEDGLKAVEDEPASPAVSPELIASILAAINGAKSTEPVAETTTPEPPTQVEVQPETKARQHTATQPAMQRKYANIFLAPSTVAGGAGRANNFKSRIESMSERERRRTVYGMFGRAVKCIHAATGDIERAAYTAEHKFMDAEMAREFKALSATSPTDGGYLVPEVYANEIIEMLYPMTVIYNLGARRLGMTNGNLNLPKQKTGTRATFIGENRQIPSKAPKFGNLKLSAKKLTALIPMSNDLLRSTSFDNDVIVGQDVTKQMALGVDYGAISGTGGEFQPLGITKNKNVLHIDTTALDAEYASSSGVLTASFPNYLVAAVLKNNVYAEGLGFVFNTSVEQFFKAMRDNVGGFIFADEMNSNGTLAGYPYKATNLLETTGGKTQIIFGNWNDLVIGEQGALEIETSREGSWTDESGNLVSAFENDQTLIRAINHVDTGLRHEESFAIADKVSVPV